MSNRPARPWFRFHLLTALLIALGASGILGLNVSERETFQASDLYGWPIEFAAYAVDRDQWYFRDGFGGHSYRRWFLDEDGFVKWSGKWLKWFPVFLLPDVLIWIGILALIAILSEYLLRRREGRKP